MNVKQNCTYATQSNIIQRYFNQIYYLNSYIGQSSLLNNIYYLHTYITFIYRKNQFLHVEVT